MKKIFGILMILFVGISFAAVSDRAVEEQQVKLKLSLASIPFLKNSGQYPGEVAYYARTFGGTLFVTDKGETVYSLPKVSEGAGNTGKKGVRAGIRKETVIGVALKEYLVGAGQADVTGREKTSARINYFKGNDPAKWQRNIESYNAVSLGEVYENIELTLRARGNNAEKIFHVMPGGAVKDIRIKVEGGHGLEVDKDGQLVVKTELGDISFTKPFAYQKIRGGMKGIKTSYRIISEDTYSFAVNRYDRRKPLVIDPLLASTFIGGSYSDYATTIAIDSNDNIFVAGNTASEDFPTTQGAYETEYKGGANDVFISKFNNDLTQLLASTFIGGDSNDTINFMVIDKENNILFAGQTSSEDFPATDEAYNENYNGGSWDAFIGKFNNSLSELLVSTFLGGEDFDRADGLAIDTMDNVFVAGTTSSEDFPVTDGAYAETLNGNSNAFVGKFDKNLAQLLASTFIGGSEWNYAYSIAIDSQDNVFITGMTSSENFPATTGAYDEGYNGGGDTFVSKFQNDLTQLLASTFMGGINEDTGYAVTIDSQDNVFITGRTSSENFPATTGAYDEVYNGHSDVFLGKFDNDLTQLLASTFMGGINEDNGYAVAIDNQDNVFVAGNTESESFPTTLDAYAPVFNGIFDGFISKFDNNLTELLYSTFLGGGDYDYANAIAMDSRNNLFVAGETYSTDFPVTPGAYDTAYNGGFADAFVSKFEGKKSCPFFGTGNGNCFIATAAYGTPMASEVVKLRNFRDRHLLTNRAGRAFVRWYYKHSPSAASYISRRPAVRMLVRTVLRPIAWLVSIR
ncbi:MAG: SBBP repeat-containing protein [Candidatus Omnitrophica bacterium]|nr:SBBP repeat-containing protein [Candidatus Omnitrophota bacterium]